MSQDNTYNDERLREIGMIVDRFVTNKYSISEGKDYPKIAAFLFGLRETNEGPISGIEISKALELTKSTIVHEKRKFLECMADSIYYLTMGLEKEERMREGRSDL